MTEKRFKLLVRLVWFIVREAGQVIKNRKRPYRSIFVIMSFYKRRTIERAKTGRISYFSPTGVF